MQPWRDRRRARRRSAVLSARARHRRGDGARACWSRPSSARPSSRSGTRRRARPSRQMVDGWLADGRCARTRATRTTADRATARHGHGRDSQPLRRRGGARGLPDPVAHGARQAAGLSRQRRVSAQKPRAVIDAMRRVYESEYANVHRGVLLPQRSARPTLYEAARDKLRAFLNARSARRDRLHAQRDRSDQPGRLELGPQVPRSRRRDRHLGDGAPLQHRAVADAARREGPRRSRSRRSTTTASSCWTRIKALLSRAHEAGRDHPHLQRARHDHAGEGDRAPRP